MPPKARFLLFFILIGIVLSGELLFRAQRGQTTQRMRSATCSTLLWRAPFPGPETMPRSFFTGGRCICNDNLGSPLHVRTKLFPSAADGLKRICFGQEEKGGNDIWNGRTRSAKLWSPGYDPDIEAPFPSLFTFATFNLASISGYFFFGGFPPGTPVSTQ